MIFRAIRTQVSLHIPAAPHLYCCFLGFIFGYSRLWFHVQQNFIWLWVKKCDGLMDDWWMKDRMDDERINSSSGLTLLEVGL